MPDRYFLAESRISAFIGFLTAAGQKFPQVREPVARTSEKGETHG